MRRANSLMVDHSHLGRRSSGIERITRELFSAEALHPLPVEGAGANNGGKLAVVASQMLGIPATMMARPDSVWAFSGFPPSPLATMFRERCVFYVHDLFLLTRVQDLNRAAKLYMAFPFKVALKRMRYFLVNSATTGRNLAPYLAADAKVQPYRPSVRNVFGLAPDRRKSPGPAERSLIVGAIGTVEPRKNFLAAAAIVQELAQRLNRNVELHIVGRAGWGEDHSILSSLPHVRLHGFLPDDDARAVIESFDLLICTSHDEGLGLPLLEVQYAGLQVVAPDQPVFAEVLGSSGTFIDPSDAPRSASLIADTLQRPDWRETSIDAALSNILRWNALADGDREQTVMFLADRLAAQRR